MKEYKISVVVPVYNVEKYIRRCLESIEDQTMTDIEIVVVNDSTPDNSMEIVSSMMAADDRIKVIEHQKNLGLMRARQTGYKAAKGEYITFCDSDDYLPKDALEKLYSKAISSEADVVIGNFTYIQTDGTEIPKHNLLKYGFDKQSVFKSLLCGELYHSIWGKLYKASVFKNYTYVTYDHFTNGEDGCLFYQIINNSPRIVLSEGCVYNYMQNKLSSTQVRYNEKAIKSICILNNMRMDIVSTYPELKRELIRCITSILCSLYAQGYDNDANLDYYIKENGLSRYVSFSNIIMYCKRNVLIHLIKRRVSELINLK